MDMGVDGGAQFQRVGLLSPKETENKQDKEKQNSWIC